MLYRSVLFKGKLFIFDQITGNLLILLKLLENTDSFTWMLYRSVCFFNISWICIKSLVFPWNKIPIGVFMPKYQVFNEIFKIIRFSWKIYHFEALYMTNAMKLKVFIIIKVKIPLFPQFSVHSVQFELYDFYQTGCIENFMAVCANVQFGLYQFFIENATGPKVNTPMWYQTKNNGKFLDNSNWHKSHCLDCMQMR